MRKGRKEASVFIFYEIKMENQKFFFCVKLGIFCLELGKNHTFWHWELGRISAPKSDDGEPCNYTINNLKQIILETVQLAHQGL